jgi:hypothetical protein
MLDIIKLKEWKDCGASFSKYMRLYYSHILKQMKLEKEYHELNMIIYPIPDYLHRATGWNSGSSSSSSSNHPLQSMYNI